MSVPEEGMVTRENAEVFSYVVNTKHPRSVLIKDRLQYSKEIKYFKCPRCQKEHPPLKKGLPGTCETCDLIFERQQNDTLLIWGPPYTPENPKKVTLWGWVLEKIGWRLPG